MHCVYMERFNDMLATATASLRSLLLHVDQASIVSHLPFVSQFLFCYTDSSETKNIYQKMYGHGLIQLRPSDENFFIVVL